MAPMRAAAMDSDRRTGCRIRALRRTTVLGTQISLPTRQCNSSSAARPVNSQNKNGLIADHDEAVSIFGAKPHLNAKGGPSFKSYTLNEEPQPQVLFTLGFSNLNPAPSRVST